MWGKWWVYDPGILVRDPTLWPNPNQSLPEQLNSLTRCLVIVVIVIVILQYYRVAGLVLVIGIVIILAVGYQMQASMSVTSHAAVPQLQPSEPSLPTFDRPVVSYMQVVPSIPSRVFLAPPERRSTGPFRPPLARAAEFSPPVVSFQDWRRE